MIEYFNLKKSLYYPSCGTDFDVMNDQRIFHFVYSDYKMTPDLVLDSLRLHKEFKLMYSEYIDRNQLFDKGFRYFHKTYTSTKYFSYYCVLFRESDSSLISLLYINMESVHTYYNLYSRNMCSPEVVFFRRIGVGFGGGWTDYYENQGFMYRIIVGNPYGLPSRIFSDVHIDWNMYDRIWTKRYQGDRMYVYVHNGRVGDVGRGYGMYPPICGGMFSR